MRNSSHAIAVLAAVLCFGIADQLPAAVRLPRVFADHMVLQRDKPIRVWGWANPGEVVTVSIGGRTAKIAADAKGAWRVDRDTLHLRDDTQNGRKLGPGMEKLSEFEILSNGELIYTGSYNRYNIEEVYIPQ